MAGNNGSIGVFDSGLGGLTVVKALRRKLPDESIVYVGDTARVPYGNKSAALVTEYSREIAEFLVKQNAKMIVVACNTASAVALPALKDAFSVPVTGVIEPGAEAASMATVNGRIGVLGTIATVSSGAYADAISRKTNGIHVVNQACPLLVPLAEEGWIDGPVTEDIIHVYLDPVIKENVDTMILGCTHYPILKDAIQKITGETVNLVDSADTVAAAVDRLLQDHSLVSDRNTPGNLKLFVTDMPARFEAVAQRFLGEPLPEVKTIHLPWDSAEE